MTIEPVLFLPLHYFANLAYLDAIVRLCEVPRDFGKVLDSLCQWPWLSHLPHGYELATINLHLTVFLYYTSIFSFLDIGWGSLESTLMGLFEHSQCAKPRVSFFCALMGVSPALINQIPGQYLEPQVEGDDRGSGDLKCWSLWTGMTQRLLAIYFRSPCLSDFPSLHNQRGYVLAFTTAFRLIKPLIFTLSCNVKIYELCLSCVPALLAHK